MAKQKKQSYSVSRPKPVKASVLIGGVAGAYNSVEVDAFQSACSQLVVHRELTLHENGKLTFDEKRWNITHIPTGLAVLAGIRHRSWALVACEIFNSIPEEEWKSVTRADAQAFYRKHRKTEAAARFYARNGHYSFGN